MRLPEEFLERMKIDLKDEFSGFLACYEKEPLNALRVNTLKLTPEEFKGMVDFCGDRVEWCNEAFYYEGKKGNHPSSMAGLFYSQEPSAMLTAELADIKEDDYVLDLCAAPGGKSTQIAAKLNGSGILVANEINTGRAKILSENIERMGIRNVLVTNMAPESLAKLFPSFFDKIIVDAPCSGEGMFRKDPNAILEWSTEHTESCAKRQLAILLSAEKMLRNCGKLVYSTCTFSKKENEETSEKISELTPLKLINTHKILPHKMRGEGHFAAEFIKEGCSARIERKVQRSASSDFIEIYRKFESDNLNIKLDGEFISFGDFLYLLPKGVGSLDKIKCVRAGLMLGEIRKGRFVPAHHLCMSLKKEDFKRTISFNENDINYYRQGGSIAADSEKGYGAALYNDKFPIGWYKYSDGVAKNHYPKYLRG